MLLSQIINREIVVGKTTKGVIKGVGISLKTQTIKYYLCEEILPPHQSFAISAVPLPKSNLPIRLSRLRTVLPKHSANIFLGLPVYSYEGAHLGDLENLSIENLSAVHLYTNKGFRFPVGAITACYDALLLKKEQPYPLGQRIPTPLLSTISNNKEGVVTKPVLRASIENRTLIKLTLSLPPFSLDELIN